MDSVTEYTLACGISDSLISAENILKANVRAFLDDGYQPFGGLTIATEHTNFKKEYAFFQPMVRYDRRARRVVE